MIVTIAYNEYEGDTHLKSFVNAGDAEDYIAEKQLSNSDFRGQILVDYAEVQHYKEKFEELYELMKNNMFGNIEKASKDSRVNI